jgi:multidrug efflux system membrane fusion protein
MQTAFMISDRRFLPALALALVCVLAGCKGEKTTAAAGPTKGGPGGGRGDMAIPVTVAKATQKDVPIQAEVIGSIEAFSSVVLKPQISGQILEAHFTEGEFVKKGQLMLTIDPRPLEAQLAQLKAQIARDQAALSQAQANLARDRAMESNAKTQADRAIELWKGGIISKEQYDQYATTVATYAATIKADQAAIENSQAQIEVSKAAVEAQNVQLGYTKIYAPIAGRTGTLTVKPGNVVMANQTELSTINQIEPVFVSFSLPEVNLPALRQSGGQKLPVSAIPEEGGTPQTGTLAFYENTVDPTTGTVRLKATFTNQSHVLWPGQFVRVTLKLGERSNAILIPSQAVQSGQEGTFVYVVKPDSRVDIKQVVASARLGDETVVDRGVEAGDTVVTEGTLRLIQGARVAVRERGAGAGGRGGTRGGMGGPGGGGAAAGGSPQGGGEQPGASGFSGQGGPSAPGGPAAPGARGEGKKWGGGQGGGPEGGWRKKQQQ